MTTEAPGWERFAEIQVDVLWDQQAGVYVGSSDDVLGLVVEAQDLDSLLAKVRERIPELMQVSGMRVPQGALAICLRSPDGVPLGLRAMC